jgi:hypothetical protein
MTTMHRAMRAQSDERIGGHMQLVPFFQKTRNGSCSEEELGKGFGVAHKNAFKMRDAAEVTALTADLDAGYMLHDQANPDASAATADITLAPEHKAYGLNFSYLHELEDVSEGLFFRIDTGMMKVQHKMGVEFDTLAAGQGNAGLTLDKYLNGSLAGADANNLQAKLERGKIDDSETREDSGFNDVEMRVGWRFVDTETTRMSLAIAGLIPTGNEPTCEYLFEPLYGSRHFQFGVGLDGCAQLWEEDGNSISFQFDAQYRYGFENTVKRLLGLSSTVADYGWGHYHLVQKVGAAVDTPLIPAANVLAQDLKVTPGSMFDGSALVSFCAGNFVLDLGYNIYATAKQKPKAAEWADGTYFRALSVGQRGPKPNESLATREAWTEDPMEGEWPRKRWLASLVL